MKNSIYLLLFVIAFIACDNGNEYAQEAEAEMVAEEMVKVINEKSETVTEKIVYEFEVEKEQFELNEDFHVMATSGLRMRATPELKGKTILTIPYDGLVERVDNNDYGTLEIEEIKDFKINGNWIKVRYDGKEGYVFDGFLTKFPLPKIVTYMDYDNRKYDSPFSYYLRTKVGGVSEKYDTEKYQGCESKLESDCICAYSQDFGPISYIVEYCSEKGGGYELKTEGLSLAEVYFIIKALDLNNLQLSNEHFEDSESITYDKTAKEIYFEADGAGCYTTIKKGSDNTISLDIYCGC
jgi:hypothetical protein